MNCNCKVGGSTLGFDSCKGCAIKELEANVMVRIPNGPPDVDIFFLCDERICTQLPEDVHYVNFTLI